MESPADRVVKLTDAEKEALRLYLKHSSVKDIARGIGIGTDAVEQRLARARRKLQVNRSLDAAHILASAEGDPIYERTVYSPSSSVGCTTSDAQATSSEIRWKDLVPTKGRPWNALPVWARVTWMIAATIVVGLCTLIALNLGDTVARIIRSI